MTTVSKFYTRHWGSEVPFRVRIFNTICFGLFIMAICMVLYVVVTNGSKTVALVEGIIGVYVIFLEILGQITKKHYSVLIYAALIGLCIFAVPALFLTGGGITTGFPCALCLAIAFPLIILDTLPGNIFASCLAVYYAGIYFVAYKYNFIVLPWTGKASLLLTYILGVAVAAAVLSFLIKIVLGIYQDELKELSELEKAHDKINSTDPLTSLSTPEYAKDYLKKEMKISWETKSPLTVMMISIKDFGNINTKLGFHIGDDILIKTADYLRSYFSEDTLVSRFTGRKFLVIFPNTASFALQSRINEIKTGISKLDFDGSDNFTVSADIAVSQYTLGMSCDELIDDVTEKVVKGALS